MNNKAGEQSLNNIAGEQSMYSIAGEPRMYNITGSGVQFEYKAVVCRPSTNRAVLQNL